MKLIYLYIENYKNIQNQGFNFTTQFKCDYKDGNLIIDKNESYIENFFGDNIEVSAIVGENGSGKSSIFKLIFLLFYCKNYNFEDNPIYHDNIIESVRPFVNTDLFLIIKIGAEYKKISMSEFIYKLVSKYQESKDIIVGTKRELKKCTLVEYEEITKSEFKAFSIHFNYMLDTMYDSTEDKWVKGIYHKADSYETSLLLEPYKNNSNKQLIDLDIIEYLNNQNLLRFYSKVDFEKNLFDFFIPNKINLNYVIRNFDWLNLNDEEFKCLSKCKYFVAFKFFKLFEDNNIFLSLREQKKEVCKICRKIDKLYDNRQYSCINKLYIVLKVLESDKKLFDESEYKKISDWATRVGTSQIFFKLPDLDYGKLISSNAPQYEVRKITNCILFEKNEVYNNSDFKKTMQEIYLVNIETIKEILEFIPPWIEVEFYEENKSLKSLSSGEKSFFTLIMNLFYQVHNINDRSEYDTIKLFLDEIELGFHPQWQKKFINFLIYSLPLVNKKKVNIYFATHSPFILSDIPRQNIVFLKDGKQVDALEKKQTFGANIHTLLADGFFMDGGLMGEFAKEKIEEVIKFLNNEKSKITDKKEAQKIINIIGEPVLKNQLQKMLDSKRLDKIDELEDEIELLKHRIEILRRNQ